MKKIRFIAWTLVCALLLGGVPAMAAQEEVTVNIAWENVSDAETARWRKYVIEPFEAAYPNIRINMEFIPDITVVMKVQLAAGEGPDAFSADNVDIMQYWKSGSIQSWDKYVQEGMFQDVFGWSMAATRVEGAQAALPMSYEGMMLWYNQDLLDANGWSVPTNREELEAVCAQALQKGIVPFALGCNNTKGRNSYMWALGDYLCSYAGPEAFKAWMKGDITSADPLIEGAFQTFVDHWNADYITERQTVNLDNNAAAALWLQQMALFHFQGSWFSGTIANTEIPFQYGCTYFPALREGVEPNMCVGIGEVALLNANAQHPDEAALFFNYLYSQEDNLIASIGDGRQPLSRAFDAKRLPGSVHPNVVEMYAYMSEASSQNKVGYTIWTFVPGTVAYSMYSDIENVLLGQGTLREYLNNLDALLVEARAAGWSFSL